MPREVGVGYHLWWHLVPGTNTRLVLRYAEIRSASLSSELADISGTYTLIPQGAASVKTVCLEFSDLRLLIVSQEMTEIELTPAALRHTLFQGCTVIIDGCIRNRFKRTHEKAESR